MSVKFWHTSLRFWFFFSYIITTVLINKLFHDFESIRMTSKCEKRLTSTSMNRNSGLFLVGMTGWNDFFNHLLVKLICFCGQIIFSSNYVWLITKKGTNCSIVLKRFPLYFWISFNFFDVARPLWINWSRSHVP